MHDLSKLHPKHIERYKEFQTNPDTPDVPDDLYEFWVNLNKDIPDILNKDESDLTKKQKVRLAKFLELKGKPVVATWKPNPNAVREFDE